MANEINSTELRFDIIKEVVEGVTPTTGGRLDLPCTSDQGPLTHSRARITDDTRRANRETSVPTDGATTIEGSLSVNLRACAAMDVLIESAISGQFDEDGVAAAGEDDVSFTLFTTLRDRTGNYLGYQDKGLQVTKLSISNSANSDDSINTSMDIMGLSRDTLNAKNPLAVTATTAQAFNYIDVGNLTVNGESVEFTDFNFDTGVGRGQRRVFGQANALNMAPTSNRETTLSFKLYRGDFDIASLVTNPCPVSFDIVRGGVGYRFKLNYAKAMLPTDELSDTGLLAAVEFTAHAYDDITPALQVEKL